MSVGAPFAVLDDTYHLWVPIEDNDLMKSVDVDENGDYIVQGVMTSDVKDEEDDSIDPSGMDCSYFLEKGWVKYEHGNNPNQFIGEPLAVKVGQFRHPTMDKSVNGIYVKTRLFAQRELTKQAVRTMEDLAKSHTKRRMGWSIEGSVKDRCRKTGKIVKSVLRNVVLTMNPVNTVTWAELSKSFAKNHELTIDMDKSMDTGSMAQLMPQSLEGHNTEEDEQERWLKSFRDFCKSQFLSKSARHEFITSSNDQVRDAAFDFAILHGAMVYDEAFAFSSYIAENHGFLKSFCKVLLNGGERMATNTETLAHMAQVLDTSIEELQKSLGEEDAEFTDDEFEDGEEIAKSMDGDDDDSDDSDDSDNSDDYEEDGDDTEKALHSNLSKSLAETHGQAFEVSDVLADMTEEIGFEMQGLQKSLSSVMRQNNAMVNALVNQGELLKSMVNELTSAKEENAELRKSVAELQETFGDILQRPVGRKSATSQRDVQSFNKSMTGGSTQTTMNRAQIMEVLEKSFESGNTALGKQIMRFNAGVSVHELQLPPDVKQQLGLSN